MIGPRARRRVLTASVAVLALALPAVPVRADASALWAWVTVRNGTGDSFVSAPTDAGSWNDGGAGVSRLGTGHYKVTLYGTPSGGSGTSIALVSPIGGTPRTCALVGWDELIPSRVVEVRCQTLAGAAIDSRFVVHWLKATGMGGRLGYGLNWSPTSVGATPDEAYNSRGGTVTVHPQDLVAQLRFERQGVDGGVAIVVATDGDRVRKGSYPTSCSLAGLSDVVNDQGSPETGDDTLDKHVDARCWEIDGEDNIYHQHVSVFMKGLGLKGVVRKNVAYLLARKPGASSYQPATVDRYSSSGGATTVRRLGTGRYEVTFAGMPKGGGAQVTAFNGAERRVCTIAGITTKAAPPRVKVSCFDHAGARRDTRFTLAYTR